MERPLLRIAAASSFFGIFCHLAFFIRGEWDRHTPKLMLLSLIIPPMLYYGLPYSGLVTSNEALTYTATIIGSFNTALFSSILIYRLLFHPLRRYPGPLSLRLSSLTAIPLMFPKYQRHIAYKNLHEKYGDIVIIRPNEISINSAAAVTAVHGPRTPCRKGIWYDSVAPYRSLQFTRDKPLHGKRRRLWDRGFNVKALNDYEPRIMAHASSFYGRLLAFAKTGEQFDLTKWASFYGIDVMSDLTFGKSFGLLESGVPNDVWTKMHTDFPPATGISLVAPWFFHFLMQLPGVSAVRERWYKVCWAQVVQRLKMKKDKPDLFTHLIDPESSQTTIIATTGKITDRSLLLDSELAIVAGTDTTSTTLASSLYLLALNPDKLALLRKEIDGEFTDIQDFTYKSVVKMPYLDGVINEALRLYPPVPAGLQRATPPEGIEIDGIHFPGNVNINTPTWVIHRDPRNFISPLSFLPERWSTSPGLILQREAFFPFALGIYSCAGKPLAMMELRVMIALIVKTFDLTFVDRDVTVRNFSDIEGESAMRESFTLALPECAVRVKLRM